MNILSLVFAVLLILSFFVHTQLENYKHFVGIKKEYNDFIKNTERETYNTQQTKIYEKLGKGETDPKSKDPKTKPGIGRINFILIVNQEERDKNAELSKQHTLAFKELIYQLYRNTHFFRRMEKKRPHFVDEMIKALQKAAGTKKITIVQEIENLHFDDDTLRYAYYQMMKGKKSGESLQPEQDFELLDFDDEGDEEEEEADKEVNLVHTYVSIKDFIHFQPNHQKIRIYLASTEVLRAIFADEETVQEILNTREDLYNRVKKDKLGTLVAQEELSKFKDKTKPGIKEDILDFTVTKTNVKKYR